MIRGTDHQSFSVLVIALIVGVGSLVIIVSLNIESLASCIQTCLNRGRAARDSWHDHDMLQLKLWEKRRVEQHSPIESSSFCHRFPRQTPVQKDSDRPHPTIEPTSTPDPGQILYAVSVASYQEGFKAGSQGPWI
jgi:hypothetical protein